MTDTSPRPRVGADVLRRTFHAILGPQRKNLVLLALVLGFAEIIAVFVWAHLLYQFDPLIGWDTPWYVGQANLVLKIGPIASMVDYQYPQLYVQLLALVSLPIGDATLPENVLPPVLACLLVVCYVRVAVRLELGSVAQAVVAITGGFSVGLLTIASALDRSLLATVLCWLVLVTLAYRDRLVGRDPADILTVAMLALIAYTEIETFLVLALVILVYACVQRRVRLVVEIFALSAAIVGAMLLAFPRFLTEYSQATAVIGASPADLTTILTYGFGGLVLVPASILGLVWLGFRKTGKLPTNMGRLVLVWSAVCYALFGLLELGVLGLPPLRALYLVPIPILLGCACDWIVLYRRHGVAAQIAHSSGPRRRRWGEPVISSKSVGAIVLAGLIAGTAFVTLPALGSYYTPYISSQEYQILKQAGGIVKDSGYDAVLVPVLGVHQMYFWSLYEAYLSIQIPHPVTMYGSLRYILSGLNPGTTEPFSSWSAYQKSAASQSFSQAQVYFAQSGSNVTSLPILLILPLVYNTSQAESLPNLTSFEKAPGIYLVPAGVLRFNSTSSWISNAQDLVSQNGFWHLKANDSASPATMASLKRTHGAEFMNEWSILSAQLSQRQSIVGQ